MKRLALAALLALATTPALAEGCKLLTPQVQYCLDGTSWAGIEEERVPGMGTIAFRNGALSLMLGVAPEFALAAWDGTPEGIGAIVEAFAGDGDGAAQIVEPVAINADNTEATAAFAPAEGIVVLLTVIRHGDLFTVVQTAGPGSDIGNEQRQAHAEAVAALKETAQ